MKHKHVQLTEDWKATEILRVAEQKRHLTLDTVQKKTIGFGGQEKTKQS